MEYSTIAKLASKAATTRRAEGESIFPLAPQDLTDFIREMYEALQDEIEVINSIYGDGTIQAVGESSCILCLPERSISVRLHFPQDYPDTPPTLLGSKTSGEYARKGEASRAVDMVREILGRTYRRGEVCLFDLLEEVGSTSALGQGRAHGNSHLDEAEGGTLNGSASALEYREGYKGHSEEKPGAISLDIQEPLWVLSEGIS